MGIVDEIVKKGIAEAEKKAMGRIGPLAQKIDALVPVMERNNEEMQKLNEEIKKLGEEISLLRRELIAWRKKKLEQ